MGKDKIKSKEIKRKELNKYLDRKEKELQALIDKQNIVMNDMKDKIDNWETNTRYKRTPRCI